MAVTAIHTPTPGSRKSSNPGSPPVTRPNRFTQAPPSRGQTGPPVVRLSRKPLIAGATSSPDSLVGGQPLEPVVQEKIERSFNVDLSSVRVHSDTRAREASRNLSARALTYGSQILLGPSERSNDVALLAHEAAHVVQQQGAPRLQPWAERHSDGYEHEAHQASSAVVHQQPFSVNQRTGGSRVQRLGISNVLDYFADKANNIPGFRMFTIILGVNPINMSRVERSAANIIRALIEFLPGGKLITDAMENHGVFEKIGNWVDEQIRTLGISGSAIKEGITRFLDSLGWSDILHPGDVWERAKRIFTDPIDRIIKFAKSLVTGIIKFIKDAILRPLAKLAEGTRGYDLLRAILGEDPVTGEKYPRTAETLIGGFMKLIGQEEIWENMKKANAISRAWAWFQGAMKELLGFVQRIPSLFVDAFKSLELMDIVLVPRAFFKIAKVFGGFILDFIRWGGNAVWMLLQIIFEVVAPDVVPYLKKVGAAFKLILKNPIGFVKNLVKAAIQGFRQFAGNIGKHLKASIIEWLTGSLTGVYIPQSFEFREIVKFVLSVLGLSWANIRQKLVKVVGETAVKTMETGFDLVVTLVTQGPAAAWEKIKEQLGNLKEMAMQAIMDFVIETVVAKAVAKLVSMFIPGAAFISAIVTIYDTVMVFISKLQKIIQVAKAFLDSIVSIANGVITAAAEKVESTLAGLLTLAINFLAGFVGLGRIADKVMNIINTKIRGPIDKALDKVIDWIVTMAKKLFGAAKQGVAALVAWWKSRKEFSVDGEKHSLFFKGEDRASKLRVASDEKSLNDFLDERQKALDSAAKKDKKVQKAIDDIKALQKKVDGLIAQRKPPAPDKPDPVIDKQIAALFDSIATLLPTLFRGTDWGTEDNPVVMTDYPKKALSLYRPLFLGPRVTGVLQQSILQAKMPGSTHGKAKAGWDPYGSEIDPATLDTWILQGGRIQRFEPFQQTAWPWKPPEADSAVFGISNQYRVQTGGVFKYEPGEGTPGGGLINKSVRHFGYRSTTEGTDGDHVLETQLIGVKRANTIPNLWPLLQNQNRHGLQLKNTSVENAGDPSLKIKTLDDAWKKKKKKELWVIIKKTRDISS
jgi:hypothetical protein